MRCAVVGAGAWGTALADLLACNGHAVRLWALEAEVARSINERRENPIFLPGFSLAKSLQRPYAMADLPRCCSIRSIS